MILDKERNKVLQNLKKFDELSKCRNLNFPNNTLLICETNLNNFLSYYENEIIQNMNYKTKFDYILVTHIINFLASVKSYLNRMKRFIEKIIIDSIYKKDFLIIFEKFWKAKRGDTCLDKIIMLRDEFEHEKISGISLQVKLYKDRIEKTVLINKTDITKLFIESFNELKRLEEEINNYIELELKKLDLRYCCLFMNAFNRALGKKNYTFLFPEETQEEIDYYDKLIQSLKKLD